MADASDIDAASGDVGGDQNWRLAFPEGVQGAFALGLRAIAVNGEGAGASFVQRFRDFVGAPLCPREYQSAREFITLYNINQSTGFFALPHKDDALIDLEAFFRFNLNTHRIAQQTCSKLGDWRRHSR